MIKSITKDLYYIGVDDTTIDLFESQYPVPEGMSYNSYLLLDSKIAIFDTTDARTVEQWGEQLTKALDGRKPDYLIVHHVEPDHSALAMKLLEQYPGLTVVASQKAVQLLSQFFPGFDFASRAMVVREGDELCLGEHTLRFVMAPMVHWPEVMVSYDTKDQTLFSADAFGKFGALCVSGFTDQEDTDWACEARRYYFNICGKYGVPVQTLLRKVSALDVKRICPLHGPVLADTIADCVALYSTWSAYQAEKQGVLIAHASIHGGTAQAAQMLATMLEQRGIDHSVIDLCREDVSYAVEDAFMFDRVVLAASSYDAGVFPPMQNLIHHLTAKNWQNKNVAIIENGSWAPSAAKTIKDVLANAKNINIIEPVITIKSRLSDENIRQLEMLSQTI